MKLGQHATDRVSTNGAGKYTIGRKYARGTNEERIERSVTTLLYFIDAQ